MRAATFTLPAHAVAVPQARRLLHEACDSQAIGLWRRPDMGLALTEAFSNAVRHAYPGRSGSVDVSIDAERGGELAIVVADHGVGLRDRPSADPGAGSGLRLMRIVSRCEHSVTAGGGTTVRLVFDA